MTPTAQPRWVTCWSSAGHPADGLAWIEKAMRLNPFHPPLVPCTACQRALFAATAFRKRRKRSSGCRTKADGRLDLRRATASLAVIEEAKAEVAAILKAKPDYSISEFMDQIVLLERPEDRELFREGLIKAGLPE